MRASSLVVASALAAGALVGCEPTAPATPSFQVDVMPILAANCVRCHGFPSLNGAPHSFRLDSYSSTQVAIDADGNPVTLQGVAAYSSGFEARITSSLNQMPPRFPLEPWQIDTLLAWTGSDPQVTPVRGEARPGNQLPILDLHEVSRDSTHVVLAYQLHDPDGDLVVGQLCDDDGGACAFVAPLQSGSHQVVVDTTGFTLPIALRAKLDDGAGMIEQVALTMERP